MKYILNKDKGKFSKNYNKYQHSIDHPHLYQILKSIGHRDQKHSKNHI